MRRFRPNTSSATTMMAYPPPTTRSEILKNSQNSLSSFTRARRPYDISILRAWVSGRFFTVTRRMPFSSDAATVAGSAVSGRSTLIA